MGHPAEANTGTSSVLGFHKSTTITFDLNQAHRDFSTGGRSEVGETAGTAAHEGQHGIDQREGLPQRGFDATRAGESNAFTTQGYVSEGLGFKSAYGIWDPSWPADKADSLRNEAIEENATDAATKECAPENGGC